MTSLHQLFNQEIVQERESAVERAEWLYSRWSSSVWVTVDKPPSQPRNRRQMSGGSSSDSVKESSKYPGVDVAHRRGNAFERPQQESNAKWTCGFGAITDTPPLQPLSRRVGAVKRLQRSHSRWSSGSRATFDTTMSLALARHQMLFGTSSVSAVEHSVETKNQDIFETTIMALGPLTGTGVQCAARTA
jgi:hypothetical protein